MVSKIKKSAMKKSLTSLLFLSLMMLGTASFNVSLAQDPPKPPSNHGESGNKGPSGAPLEDGVGITLLMAAAYGGYIFYRMKKRE